MRSLLGCLIVLAAACTAKDDTSAAVDSNQMVAEEGETTSEARRAATFTGRWEGRSYRSESDTGVAWTNVVTVGADGNPVGSLTFKGSDMAPVSARTIEITDSTLVTELGPYTSPTAKAEVTTRTEGRVRGDSLWGTFEMTPTKDGDQIRGTFRAKRVSGSAM